MNEEDKAFYWRCAYCGERIMEGDVVFIQEGSMSGNTPVFSKSIPFHKQCFSNYLKENGNSLFKLNKEKRTIWSTSYDSYD